MLPDYFSFWFSGSEAKELGFSGFRVQRRIGGGCESCCRGYSCKISPGGNWDESSVVEKLRADCRTRTSLDVFNTLVDLDENEEREDSDDSDDSDGDEEREDSNDSNDSDDFE
ncbi:hypothetical protein LWI29_031418 [Acer saccharum]|uniref:Uncharacterized protein n=1 Tax=Acer saccharum TaxID=4024 RepID=A0AA39VYQ6_ACESA|nr:hypothetical protein LWI29_031418 [Acer saccharum]